MSELILPIAFDVDYLLDEYLEIKVVKTPRNCKNALTFLKDKLKITIIKEDTMTDIDNFLVESKKCDYKDDDYSKSTVKSYCGRILSMFTTLFGYKFPKFSSPANYKHILNKSDDLEQLPNLPRVLLQYSTSDPKLYDLILKLRKWLNNSNFSDSYRMTILQNLRNTLVPLRDYFVNGSVTREIIVNHIQETENTKAPNKVKTRNPVFEANTASYVTRDQCRAFNVIMSSGIVPHLVDCKSIAPVEIKIKAREIEKVERDYFTNEELDKIANSYETETERLIFTIFLTIGLRMGGLLNLKIKNMFKDDCSTVLETGTALEKGGKTRTFVIFPALKQALLKYRASNEKFFEGPEYFLFPYRFTPSNVHHINKTTVNQMFKKVCKRAGVSGDQIHTHACRKTVVVNLMKDGNTIDNVAKFIGHANPITTAKHYWVTTPSELVSSMNISWLVGPVLTSNTKDIQSNTDTTISSGPNLMQIQKIAVTIAEGFKAQERLQHAVSIMTPEQLIQMENMWNEDAKENVAINTKKTMIEIAQAASTIVSKSQVTHSLVGDYDGNYSD